MQSIHHFTITKKLLPLQGVLLAFRNLIGHKLVNLSLWRHQEWLSPDRQCARPWLRQQVTSRTSATRSPHISTRH